MADTQVSPLLEGADFAAVFFADGKFRSVVKRGDRVDQDAHHTEAQALSFVGLVGGSPDPNYWPRDEQNYIVTAVIHAQKEPMHHGHA